MGVGGWTLGDGIRREPLGPWLALPGKTQGYDHQTALWYGGYKARIIFYYPNIFIYLWNMDKVITSTNFQEYLEVPGLLVIDFWATWCGPCRMLSPIVDDLAAEFEGRATIAKCNVDDCEDIAAQFGVRNIPTLVFVKNGAVVDRTVGVMPKQELEAKINLYL